MYNSYISVNFDLSPKRKGSYISVDREAIQAIMEFDSVYNSKSYSAEIRQGASREKSDEQCSEE